MDILVELLAEASTELKAMIDAVRDDAPAWGKVMSALFGVEAPRLGTIRRALGDPRLVSFLRTPTERACGRGLRAVEDLAEAFAEIASAPSNADPKSLKKAYELASALEGRVMVAAR